MNLFKFIRSLVTYHRVMCFEFQKFDIHINISQESSIIFLKIIDDCETIIAMIRVIIEEIIDERS